MERRWRDLLHRSRVCAERQAGCQQAGSRQSSQHEKPLSGEWGSMVCACRVKGPQRRLTLSITDTRNARCDRRPQLVPLERGSTSALQTIAGAVRGGSRPCTRRGHDTELIDDEGGPKVVSFLLRYCNSPSYDSPYERVGGGGAAAHGAAGCTLWVALAIPAAAPGTSRCPKNEGSLGPPDQDGRRARERCSWSSKCRR